MIADVVVRSLRSRSKLIPVEELLQRCEGSRMPEVVPERLTASITRRAAEACPTGAITLEGHESSAGLRVDYGECIGCGKCIDVAEGAIRPATRFLRCGVKREELVSICRSGQGDQRQAAASADATRDKIFALMGRALNVRQLDPGSCNGCEAEITALTNPYYDLERFGIHFVASPKHADMLLVTGPVTRNMAEAARKTYEAVPEPKLVVAVGACGCSGGIFNSGQNQEIAGPVDAVLPVDGYIPGCPPTPAMLVTGILEVLRRACAGRTAPLESHAEKTIGAAAK